MRAIRKRSEPTELYRSISAHARALRAEPELLSAVESAARTVPENYVRHQGWVLTALHNALWQLLHAPSLEEGIINTVMRGGDTDTNAAIAGALLGAAYGLDAVPERWRAVILDCRPQEGSGAAHPRPKFFWPVDALELAARLVLPRNLVKETLNKSSF